MLAFGGMDRRGIKPQTVILDDDGMALLFFSNGDVDLPDIPGAHAVSDGVIHQRLHRQGRQHEAVVSDVVVDVDVGKHQHLDLGVDPDVFQLLVERNQLGLVQRVQLLPQVSAESVDGLRGRLRGTQAEAADGSKGVYRKWGWICVIMIWMRCSAASAFS